MAVNTESSTGSNEAANTQKSGLAHKSSDDTNSESAADGSAEHDENAEASEALENQDEAGDESADSEDESESKDVEKPKKQKGFKKRIDKLNKKLTAEAQEKEYWKQQALKASGGQEVQKKETLETLSETSQKPKVEDFDSHAEFIEALTDWKVDQKEAAKENKRKVDESKSEYQKTVQSFQEKVQEFSKTHTDFQDLMEDVDDVPLTAGIQEALLTSSIGPAVMYELAKDRKELERINALSPLAAAREIGKIEARLANDSSSSKEQTKKLTKAPPPVSPVGTNGSAKVMKSPQEMTFKEYTIWRARKK